MLLQSQLLVEQTALSQEQMRSLHTSQVGSQQVETSQLFIRTRIDVNTLEVARNSQQQKS